MNSLIFSLALAGLCWWTPLFTTATSFLLPKQGQITNYRTDNIYLLSPIDDSLALVALYDATDGPNWTNSWNLEQPMASWYGVQLDTDGFVTCLDLDGNVNCTIDEVAPGNNLSGTLPDLQLPKLVFLSVKHNDLTGQIPDFSGLPLLTILDLSENELSGSIPNFSNLTALIRLRLFTNQLSGNVPDFSNFPVLEELFLYRNQLEGEIPNFSALPQLAYLSLGENQLIGCIPDFIALSSLEFLVLENNYLSCVVPSYEHLANLWYFDYEFNDLTYEDLLPNFAALRNHVDNNNGFLYYYRQNEIPLSTPLVGEVGGSLNIMIAVDDTVTTSVYKWYKDDVLIAEITGDNSLTLSNLTASDAGLIRCELTNPLVPYSNINTNEVMLHVVDPAGPCRLADSLTLVQLYNATDGPNWTNTWDLNQPMDSWYGIELNAEGCVSCIDLDGYLSCNSTLGGNAPGNGLSGSVPDISMAHLKHLSLGFNDLSGPIPDLATPELQVLRLPQNDLSGAIPNFADLPKLLLLDLKLNDLTGPIPNFPNLPLLEELDLGQNRLEGPIPDFSNLSQLISLTVSHNRLTGDIPDFPNLPNLLVANLGANSLGSSIPDFSNLPKLEALSIHNSELVGTIPNFSNLPALLFLNVSNNQLSGCLPDFDHLPKLNVVDADRNNLSCEIPSFSQNPMLSLLDLARNQFTFEDILPNLSTINTLLTGNSGTLLLSPQQQFLEETFLNGTAGSSLIMDLIVDDTVSNNFYQWYKDGQLYQEVEGSNKLIFNDLQFSDAGQYYCQVTNPLLPALTLTSRSIHLTVEEPSIPLCDGNMLVLDQNPIPADTYRAASIVESAGTIQHNTEVVFSAGQSVRLLPGFHAQDDARFLAYIEACDLPAESQVQLPVTSTSREHHDFSLSVFPNPGRSQTSLEYKLPQTSTVQLFIADMSGRVVRQLEENTPQNEGFYRRELDLSGIPGGIYTIHLSTNQDRAQVKMVKLDY